MLTQDDRVHWKRPHASRYELSLASLFYRGWSGMHSGHNCGNRKKDDFGEFHDLLGKRENEVPPKSRYPIEREI